MLGKDNPKVVSGDSLITPAQRTPRLRGEPVGVVTSKENEPMNFNEYAWDTEIEKAIIRLRQADIQNPAYWYETVETVEAGYDPTTRKPITISALEAWVTRCKSPPPQDEEDPTHDSPPRQSRRVQPKDQPV
jgi:hypothetical protein